MQVAAVELPTVVAVAAGTLIAKIRAF